MILVFFFTFTQSLGDFIHALGGGGLVAKSCLTLATLWTVAFQAPLSMRFSRQGYWSGLPFLSPGDLPDPGIEPGTPALQANSLPIKLWGKPIHALGFPPIWNLPGLYPGPAFFPEPILGFQPRLSTWSGYPKLRCQWNWSLSPRPAPFHLFPGSRFPHSTVRNVYHFSFLPPPASFLWKAPSSSSPFPFAKFHFIVTSHWSRYIHNAYSVPGTILSASQIPTHLILTITP